MRSEQQSRQRDDGGLPEAVARRARSRSKPGERLQLLHPPLIDYVDQFIKVREGNGKVEDTTLRTYHTHRKRLMGTDLGNKPIKDITYRDIEDFEQDLLEDGLSSSTRSHIHVFLK